MSNEAAPNQNNEPTKKFPLELVGTKVDDLKIGDVILTYGGLIAGVMEHDNESELKFLIKVGHLNPKANMAYQMVPKVFTKGMTVIVVRQAR